MKKFVITVTMKNGDKWKPLVSLSNGMNTVVQRDSKRQGYCQVYCGGKVMFNNVGNSNRKYFIVVKVQPNKQPEVVSEHQCIGNV